ncbi:MAG: CBS domain-containing protein [Anaerolineales bacterium]|nr:MAG: CBS domain-containing protein [Anaerolineales bacterium]
MLVGERMSQPVITVRPDTPILDAYGLMQKEKIRRLPVVDKKGNLIGMLAEREILHASPSQATSLSIWELNYLMSRVTVNEIMTSDVITVNVDTPLEEAAMIMADNKIGGLPVMRDGKLVGIVTETDLFKVFLELFGAREPGIRLTVLVDNEPGEISKLTSAIYNAGGNIMALGTSRGDDTNTGEITLKVEGIREADLREVVKAHVQKIVDLRSLKAI